MGDTSIQWTDKTWSPLRARVKADAAAIAKKKGYASLVQIATKMAGHAGPHCERVSHGCDHCYSDTNNGRCLPANGTGLPFDRRSRDLVQPFVDEKILLQPLKWRKPQRVFVENQSDLFGEWITGEMIDRVFAVMALCPQHTFQILTKRPERMLKYVKSRSRGGEKHDIGYFAHQMHPKRFAPTGEMSIEWPLPNLWLGVSVEDQATADERIPLLLQTPAAIRFVSYEPALGTVNFSNYVDGHEDHGVDYARPVGQKVGACVGYTPPLDWIIVGGESGPGARPFDLDWAESTIKQCADAGVACFVKQLGAKPFHEGDEPWLSGKKGGLMNEWPAYLQVRQFPEVPAC